MEKYSKEWKDAVNKKHGGWAQYHQERKAWKWHYIQNDTEYTTGNHLTRQDCEAEHDTNPRRMRIRRDGRG